MLRQDVFDPLDPTGESRRLTLIDVMSAWMTPDPPLSAVTLAEDLERRSAVYGFKVT
jgi:hypothetical protein